MDLPDIQLVLTLLLLILPEGQTANDPCASPDTLNSLKQRVTGYELTGGDTPLCDYYMTEGWYSLGSGNVIASSAEPCGTTYNWYMQGKLPNDETITQLVVCRAEGTDNDCSDTKTINVKRCGDDNYVFELFPPDGCPEAYCIESLSQSNKSDTPPDISTIKPTITPTFHRPKKDNEILFYCDFHPPVGTDFFYVVEWGISTGFSWTHTLKQFDPVRYINTFEYRKETALTEGLLKDKNFGHLGFTIACSVTAQHTEIGSSSEAKKSDPKFFGVEVLNQTVIVRNKEETTIYIRLTAPFGCPDISNGACSIDLNVFMPQKTVTSCKIPQLSQIKGQRNRCGVNIRNDQINQAVPLRLAAIDGENRLNLQKEFTLILSTQETVPFQGFFGNYFLDPIKVQVETDMKLLSGKLCYSHNDPHMRSFDGLTYENQNSGKFLLYRNTKYPTQVQMQTTECSPNIWCNCGVVVNAGRDVFIVNKCGQRNWEIRFRECKDRSLRRKVYKLNNSKYEVKLPTGTLVTISISGDLLNVDIKPGLADYQNTEGLCGQFDQDTENDRASRPGTINGADPNLSWRVLPNEDLFNSKNDQRLQPWNEETMLCSCGADASSTDIVNQAKCFADVSKICDNNRASIILEEQCSIRVSRKKRNVRGNLVQKYVDLHRTTEINFVSKGNLSYNQHIPKLVSKRMIYDKESARADCLQAFNTSAFTICSSIPDMDLSDFLENCILDAQITNSMDWSLLHLEALKDKCMHEVQVNQPISEEELADMEIIVNKTYTNATVTEAENDNVAKPVISTFSAELLRELEEVSCPNECNGNGKCNKGKCTCNENYIGDDCGIDKTIPPIMEGIPDRGECDLQLRDCQRTSVFGTNLADTDALSCHLVPFFVNSKYETIKSDIVLKRKGELQTLVEVTCPIEQSRKKRSYEETEDYIARGYTISISNDGVEYSEEDIIVIFDSECVNCTKEDGNVVCKQKLGYCIKDGYCYRFGETHGCNVCVGGTNNILHWATGQDCPIPAAPPTEPKRLWIIAAAVCPVVLIVLIIGGVIYSQSKRSLARRKSSAIHSLNDSRPGSAFSK